MTRLEQQLEASVQYFDESKKQMNDRALATVEPGPGLARASDVSSDIGISVKELVARVEKVREVQRQVMKEGHHYGTVPGAGDRKCLLKPGAEMLMLTFRLDPQFSTADRWDGEHLESVVTCTLYHASSGARLGSGVGSCSTRESKYAWRKGERKCPKCHASAIIKGREEYGGGWVCFKNKGGCGAKFGDKDQAILGQQTGRVANPDIADCYNTVRKMACKRALVAGALLVTGASELFTQDLEDEDDTQEQPAPRAQQQQRRTPDISPHGSPGDEPEPDNSTEFDRLMGLMTAIETDLNACGSYLATKALRDRLGSKAAPAAAALTRDMQSAREQNLVGYEHRRELSRVWQRLDRQVAKLEAKFADDVPAHDSTDDAEDFSRE